MNLSADQMADDTVLAIKNKKFKQQQSVYVNIIHLSKTEN
jgi:hypothetical protein